MEKDISQCFWKRWDSFFPIREINNPVPALLGFYTSVFEKRRYRPPMATLCKVPVKSAGIGLSITAVCKNAKKKTLGQDDFFVVKCVTIKKSLLEINDKIMVMHFKVAYIHIYIYIYICVWYIW